MDRNRETALFKILGHPTRLAILRQLMAAPATLTQLGGCLHKTPAHIRHHLVRLEQAGLVEFTEARPVQGGPEKYYRATQQALFIHQAVLPEASPDKITITIGSMDAGVAHLARYFAQARAPFSLLPVSLSSLDGLIAVRQGLCQMSTCHLIDPQTEEYNRSFVRHLFPGQSMALVLVYQREEGLLVKPGNPCGIRSLDDLARPDVRFVNRERGSGVRQWLDLRLDQLGIPPEEIQGYTHVAHSHPAVASEVCRGEADAGIGIAAVAREFGLHFLPLFSEPYEIALPLNFVADSRYTPFLDYLNSNKIRSAVRGLDGYSIPQNSGHVDVVG
ncbi:MAG: hypothetical protein B6D39_08340 [Anaerolineae bacterium UTCFX2]|jgi:putative molybdopterin biosynthesis protein|nr:helix-turn-helix domain-containing protein [Anaerolineales bacterium]OQY90367.1 MAG: hypothetical protein B6D39_08340 [Anaerolineae bacterium UTCFX2]